MKKTLCLLLTAAFVFMCGCQNISDYSSGSAELPPSYYTTSIMGTFESEDATSSQNTSSNNATDTSSENTTHNTSSQRPVSSQNSSTASTGASSNKSSSASSQSSVVSSQTPSFTPSGNVTYFYFDNLSAEQKRLYGIINDAVEKMTSGMVELGSCSIDDVSLAFNAVRTDHPEYFWIPSSYINEVRGGTRYIAFDYQSNDFSVSYTCTREERDRMVSALNAKIKEIRSAVFKNGMSVYELELALHDWICNNVTYITEGELVNTAYGALINGKALCEGYSRAMQLLCNEFKIPCTLVCGTAYNSTLGKWENHMWNMIRIDGDWYHLDATWDDDDANGVALHNYFNLTDKLLSSTHRADPDFSDIASADIQDGKSYNFKLPKCTATKHYFANEEGRVLNNNYESMRLVVTDILREIAAKKKKYCEFYLSYSVASSVNAETIANNYSLLDCINVVNLDGANKIKTDNVRVALSGQTFIVFLEYEGE